MNARWIPGFRFDLHLPSTKLLISLPFTSKIQFDKAKLHEQTKLHKHLQYLNTSQTLAEMVIVHHLGLRDVMGFTNGHNTSTTGFSSTNMLAGPPTSIVAVSGYSKLPDNLNDDPLKLPNCLRRWHSPCASVCLQYLMFHRLLPHTVHTKFLA
jgi:hypothetical protein